MLKRRLFRVVPLCLAFTLLAVGGACLPPTAATALQGDGLVVHEWGTFTSVAGRNGDLLGAVAVAVEPGLGDEEARRAAGERLHPFGDAYESARVAMLLGRIHQARGNDHDAVAELTSAMGSFDAIGAVPDAMKARELLDAAQPLR